MKDKSARSLWKATAMNARGQLTQEKRNTVTSNYTYNAKGLLTAHTAGGVVNLAYTYNADNTMSHRKDNIHGMDEYFSYDALNRLTLWQVMTTAGGVLQTNTMSYNTTTGNMAAKSGTGYGYTGMTYGEGNNKPHALTSNAYSGTAPANLIAGYTDFKKLKTLTQGNNFYRLTYGVDLQRRKSEYYVNDVLRLKRYYIGNYEEEVNSVNNVRKIHYLYGGGVLIQNGGVDSLLFGYTDHLGSLIALTHYNGAVMERYAYDPWGNRRNPTNWAQSDARTKRILNRGFTGHEHIDAFNIIDMNGRVYDPLTAQFLSPDPYVQAPDNWLNYNRYAYAMNNPLMYTDPDGEFIIGFISGFIRGLFQGDNPLKTAWDAGLNELKIAGGLFVSDPNKNFGERLWEVASRFTWQAPQTAFGFAFATTSNYVWQVDEVDYWGGATVISGNYWGNGGAMTLGSFISGGKTLEANPHNSLFQHEYGHYLQSQSMGPGFLSRVGIPSLMSARKDDDNHDFQLFEQDANRRAFNYFNKNVEGFYKSYEDRYDSRGWDFGNNPLDVYHIGEESRYNYYDFKNLEHRALVNSLSLYTKWYDYAGWLGGIPGIFGVGFGNGRHYINNRIK